MGDQAYLNESLTFEERAKALVAEMTLEEKVFQTLHGAKEIKRLGVKAYNYWNEALHTQARGKIRIFAVSFMAAPPARIAEYIYVRGPECQPLIYIIITILLLCIKLCTPLCRYNVRDFLHEILVKNRSQTNRLREDRCHARPRHTVQRRFISGGFVRHMLIGKRDMPDAWMG